MIGPGLVEVELRAGRLGEGVRGKISLKFWLCSAEKVSYGCAGALSQCG